MDGADYTIVFLQRVRCYHMAQAFKINLKHRNRLIINYILIFLIKKCCLFILKALGVFCKLKLSFTMRNMKGQSTDVKFLSNHRPDCRGKRGTETRNVHQSVHVLRRDKLWLYEWSAGQPVLQISGHKLWFVLLSS